MFVLRPSAHAEAHTLPVKARMSRRTVFFFPGTHPTQADKVEHVHTERERKMTLCPKVYATLQSSASAVKGSWGEGEGGREGKEVTLLVISTTVARISPHLTGS